ncbi:MAG: phosphoribosylformylglycinamidine synthase subunit PurS, partial [Deltaproteobacteria bacterium]
MLARIQAGLKPAFPDSFGEKTKKRIAADLHLPVTGVRTLKVFTVDADITEEQLEAAARGPYCDPVIQDYSMGALALEWNWEFDWLIEVGFRPGVTDNEGRTAGQALEYLLGRKLSRDEAVYTSTQFLISGSVSREEAETIARKLLANELIERFTVLSREEFAAAGGIKPYAPKVTGERKVRVAEVDLDVADEELIRISREGVLALSLDEMKLIRAYLARPEVQAARKEAGLSARITDVELEMLAQTWSEHCKHKIFNGDIDYENTSEGTRTTIQSLFDTYI